MKPLRLLLLAPCLLILGACSTPPTLAPAQIPEPPVALLEACPQPDKLPDVASAREAIEWGIGWARNAACERARSFGFIESWPR